MPAQKIQPQQAEPKGAGASAPSKKAANQKAVPQQHQAPPAIPDHDIKQNSGVTASMALQAAQKAWEYRQAAYAAGDPNAREEILAKAINKEIEAESFGKAAKYTQSGAFQGLAAGAGLGVQPGVTLGKLTGALVGGLVSAVTGLIGGGIGSVYGAMNGPMWDLGEMASRGVRGVVGDFPNWTSTPTQKKALEKMVMQTRETQAPTQEELERMKAEAPDGMPANWSQTVKDMTSWRPSMPSMPKMPNMPSLPSGGQAASAVGLGGLGASLFGGNKSQVEQPIQPAAQHEAQKSQNSTSQSKKQSDTKPQQPRQPSKPREAPTPKEAPRIPPTSQSTNKPQTTPQPKEATAKPKTGASKEPPKPQPQAAKKPTTPSNAKPTTSLSEKAPASTTEERRRPRKLAPKTNNTSVAASQTSETPLRKAPRKLETRKAAAVA